MIFRRTVGSKGQVVIPKDVRRHLGIEPGSEVVFEVKEREAVVKPGQSPSRSVEDYVSILIPKLKSKVQLEQVIEEEILEETNLRRQ